ncbi:activating signal cointegrator 1 complex subunit [Characodon lateralis]|uniref:Activating signal cointegrator 1 complex subunit n=1 Tax=Characodon lateralis TaxID=208331 RepID=A0ABU7DVN8_9TELE|nr:activating signal cointegrator 1 complex subunit [Characodon lateralis]
MMGRAGRPQFDDQGKAVILVHDIKKDFYKKFLYEPFPVESSLLSVLSDHLNAEIAAGTISSKQDAMDYITWTYFFRRLVMNPSGSQGRWCLSPAVYGREAWYTLDRSPVHRRATHKQPGQFRVTN